MALLSRLQSLALVEAILILPAVSLPSRSNGPNLSKVHSHFRMSHGQPLDPGSLLPGTPWEKGRGSGAAPAQLFALKTDFQPPTSDRRASVGVFLRNTSDSGDGSASHQYAVCIPSAEQAM